METKDISAILKDLVHRADELTGKVRELRAAEAELEQINLAIKALGGRAGHAINGIVNHIISELSWPERIKKAVGNLGQATVQDIIQELYRLEPDLKKEGPKVHNNVTTQASALATKGDLHAVKDGIKNVYSLPKR